MSDVKVMYSIANTIWSVYMVGFTSSNDTYPPKRCLAHWDSQLKLILLWNNFSWFDNKTICPTIMPNRHFYTVVMPICKWFLARYASKQDAGWNCKFSTISKSSSDRMKYNILQLRYIQHREKAFDICPEVRLIQASKYN